MKIPKFLPALLCTVFLTSAGIAQGDAEVKKAIAVLQPMGDSKVAGSVVFTKSGDGLRVEGEISGLSPGKHGFHVHQFGDLSSPDGKAAGDHFNPGGHKHGGPETDERHAGDFGNLEAGADGKAKVSLSAKDLSFSGANSVIGRSIVVHAKADDLKTQPSGDSGGRIAVGVIGVAKAD